jgi:hypothetical protein
MTAHIALRFDRSIAHVTVRGGVATWSIDGIVYGRNRSTHLALAHLESLLGWQHETCDTLRSFLRVAAQ